VKQNRIRVGKEVILKALLIVLRRKRILVYKTRHGPGVRAPGGHVELFESSEDAIRREMMEELGSKIKNLKLEGVFENIFFYKSFGSKTHEIDFVYSGTLTKSSIYKKERFIGDEDGSPLEFYWASAADIASGKIKMVPKPVAGIVKKLVR
jgi:8-oxo-dGTP pyrophosphatase MutT (NUDIX family)